MLLQCYQLNWGMPILWCSTSCVALTLWKVGGSPARPQVPGMVTERVVATTARVVASTERHGRLRGCRWRSVRVGASTAPVVPQHRARLLPDHAKSCSSAAMSALLGGLGIWRRLSAAWGRLRSAFVHQVAAASCASAQVWCSVCPAAPARLCQRGSSRGAGPGKRCGKAGQ